MSETELKSNYDMDRAYLNGLNAGWNLCQKLIKEETALSSRGENVLWEKHKQEVYDEFAHITESRGADLREARKSLR